MFEFLSLSLQRFSVLLQSCVKLPEVVTNSDSVVVLVQPAMQDIPDVVQFTVAYLLLLTVD